MLGAYDAYPVVRETLAEAGAVLGQDLWTLVAEGPGEQLNQTVNTQPLMLAADVAVYRAWLGAGGVAPAVVAGHSLGEWSALVAAGALALGDAVAGGRSSCSRTQRTSPLP
jgi:[acyl-carrier-protein] S-malonyltransferase